MRTTSFKVADDLYLVHVALDAATAPAAPERVHHVAVIDCSGSMAGDLPELRRQLKRKLPKLIAEDDTLSIVAFSGRGECYVVLEAEPVTTIADLSGIERAIDRWLRPVGLTGFKEPLARVVEIVRRRGIRPNGCSSMFFMTDGCDNQWTRDEIMRAIDELRPVVSSVTFVEYGWHADRAMLARMAERAGGTLLFAEDLDRYQPTFEAEMARRSPASKIKQVGFLGDPIGGFVWTQQDGELRAHEVEEAQPPAGRQPHSLTSLPEHARGFFFLSRRSEGIAPIFAGQAPSHFDAERDDFEDEEDHRVAEINRALYAALSLFATRMRPEIIYPILRQLGDVRLTDMFAGCFGKQRYSVFMEAAKEAAFDPSKRLLGGYDPDRVPAPDAFTVLELLEILEADGARVLLDHPEFEYRRISQKRTDASELLTLEEQARVADLNARICAEKNVRRIRELQAEVEKILSSKPAPLRFEAEKKDQFDGYPITSLTWNEDRPNISLKVRTEGVVDLTGRLPPDLAGVIPNPFPTFQYRDRTVIADGIVHVRALPVRVSDFALKQIAERLPPGARSRRVVIGDGWVQGVVYLSELPVLNRRMVLGESLSCGLPSSKPSAERLFRLQLKLEKARAAQKVYKAFRDEVVPKKESPSFRSLYGDRGAEWLKAAGFTEYSGFCPRVLAEDSGDYYLGRALEVKLRGYSSLPSIAEYRKQLAELHAGKRKSFTPAAEIMRPYIEEVEAALHGLFEDNTEEAARDAFAGWITEKADAAISVTRQLLREIAQVKFTVVVGQVWFEEFRSLDEGSMEFDCDGVRIQGKVEMKEVRIKC